MIIEVIPPFLYAMIFRISLLSLFIGILSIGCSTGPDFERNSSSDPESENFELKMPKGENYEIRNDSSVVLTWTSDEVIEEGYRIYKVLGNNTG